MELLGKGRQASVYALDDKTCIKIFNEGYPLHAILSEAEHMQFVYEKGVPSPAFYGVEKVNGQMSIYMERLHGKTALRDILETGNISSCFLLGQIQRDYHRISVQGLPDYVEILSRQIREENILTPAQREEIVHLLHKMPRDNKLVHTDYHSDNVILTKDGPKVIDWAGCCMGHPLADAARTLLSFEPGSYPIDADEKMCQMIDEIRSKGKEAYLSSYGVDREEIEAWLPLIVASRLHGCPKEELENNRKIVQKILA